jgi:hypothetical protein
MAECGDDVTLTPGTRREPSLTLIGYFVERQSVQEQIWRDDAHSALSTSTIFHLARRFALSNNPLERNRCGDIDPSGRLQLPEGALDV